MPPSVRSNLLWLRSNPVAEQQAFGLRLTTEGQPVRQASQRRTKGDLLCISYV